MLKVQGASRDDPVVKEFLREVEMMDSLRGPHIINFLGAVTVPGHLCVLTEFAPLGSLGSLLRKQILPHLLKVKFAWDCAKGMNFLHNSGIVHRDLKSDNLLVVSTNIHAAVVCKLTDFGTSKAVSPSAHPNLTAGIGTPVYMAPEILDDQQYTNAADVYSYAILLLELYANKMPYRD
jgi:serine/threonine protein kinase